MTNQTIRTGSHRCTDARTAYPTSVLQDLIQLKELLDATHAERGPAYTAAAFVFLDKLSRPHRRGHRASHLAVPQPLEHVLEELVAKPT